MTALQLQLLMMFFAGWVNRSQQDVIPAAVKGLEVRNEVSLYGSRHFVRSGFPRCQKLLGVAELPDQPPAVVSHSTP